MSDKHRNFRVFLRRGILPQDFTRKLRHDVDFDESYRALRGNKHPHAATLRGRIRSLQNRHSDSLRHYDEADLRFESARRAMHGEEDMLDQMWYWLHVYRCETALIFEARDPTRERRGVTDREFEAILNFKKVQMITINQARRAMVGLRYLLRANYEYAWYAFETLILESGRRLEDQQADFWIGASNALRALDDADRADEYLEKVREIVDGIAEPLKIVLFGSRLHVLAESLSRTDDSAYWLERIQSVSCPEKSKQCLLRRAKSIHDASVKSGGILI